MTAESAAAASSSGSVPAAGLPAGVQLGEYVLGVPLWPLRIADAYRANGPAGPAAVYVIRAPFASTPAIRDAIIAGTRAAAALPEHKHLVRTLAAGLTGEILWIATEDIDGSSMRDLLLKKRQAGAAGFGARGTGNLIVGVCAALADARHGALHAESVVVNRSGRVRVADLALGAGTAAAIAAGLIPAAGSIAPEIMAGQPPTGATDVYGTGALLYEALLGVPLERGGARPSDVVPGTTSQIDELVARACHRDPDKRFGRTDVLGEVVAELFGKGDGPPRQPTATAMSSASLAMTSLAQELSNPVSPAASGNAVIDRALAAALADSTEKWLVTKGKLDYGPFSLVDVVSQIESGEVVAGNIIMDKDTGARGDVAEHPLLGPMVDATRARRDDNRRAQAEVVEQKRDKKKGVALYLVIGVGVIGVAVAVWFIVQSARHEDAAKVAELNKLAGASLKVTVSEPKAPPRNPHPHHAGGGGGTHSAGGGGNAGPNGTENEQLDMSDEGDDSSETLPMDKVFAVYSKYGAQLGGCLQGSGESSVDINMNIDGPSGHVTFVKVNGKQGGGAYSCLNRVLRGMQFPAVHGTRTRAEFQISL